MVAAFGARRTPNASSNAATFYLSTLLIVYLWFFGSQQLLEVQKLQIRPVAFLELLPRPARTRVIAAYIRPVRSPTGAA